MPRKMEKQETAGWIDVSLPANVEREIIGLPEGQALRVDIGDLVGRYRALARSRDEAPAKAEAIDHAQRTSRLIDDLKEQLNLTPAMTKALISEDLFRYNAKPYSKVENTLNSELGVLKLLFAEAAKRMEAEESTAGRKDSRLEHTLLSDVSALLEKRGVPLLQSAEISADLLRRSGVVVPTDPAKARRQIVAIRKAQHARNTPR
jgi:hypothetical protein